MPDVSKGSGIPECNLENLSNVSMRKGVTPQPLGFHKGSNSYHFRIWMLFWKWMNLTNASQLCLQGKKSKQLVVLTFAFSLASILEARSSEVLLKPQNSICRFPELTGPCNKIAMGHDWIAFWMYKRLRFINGDNESLHPFASNYILPCSSSPASLSSCPKHANVTTISGRRGSVFKASTCWHALMVSLRVRHEVKSDHKTHNVRRWVLNLQSSRTFSPWQNSWKWVTGCEHIISWISYPIGGLGHLKLKYLRQNLLRHQLFQILLACEPWPNQLSPGPIWKKLWSKS